VDAFVADEKPEYVFLAAAKVGGIFANDSFPVDFIRDNLQIQTNVIDASYRHGVRKLCFLGSSCIYPRLAPQPIREDSLLTGPLESTNEWYAVAKIAGIKMCQAYHKQYGFNAISVMPTNLYGPGDNFDLQKSHVLPALLRKFDAAKQAAEPTVTIWGSGTPRREFLFVEDLADACCFLMENYDSPEIINVGVGEDLTIAELAMLIKGVFLTFPRVDNGCTFLNTRSRWPRTSSIQCPRAWKPVSHMGCRRGSGLRRHCGALEPGFLPGRTPDPRADFGSGLEWRGLQGSALDPGQPRR
jgi:nucleoside-diphosphate-sugar epimerase